MENLKSKFYPVGEVKKDRVCFKHQRSYESIHLSEKEAVQSLKESSKHSGAKPKNSQWKTKLGTLNVYKQHEIAEKLKKLKIRNKNTIGVSVDFTNNKGDGQNASSVSTIIRFKKKFKDAALQTENEEASESPISVPKQTRNSSVESLVQVEKSMNKFESSKRPINYDVSMASFKEPEEFKCNNKYEKYLLDCIQSSRETFFNDTLEPFAQTGTRRDSQTSNSVDTLSELFRQDFAFDKNLLKEEESRLKRQSEMYQQKRKIVTLHGCSLMFEDELDKPIKFMSSRLHRTKFMFQLSKRSVTKNRRMHSAPKSIKEIQLSEVSGSAKDVERKEKLSQKMVIDSNVYTLSQLLDFKFERGAVFDNAAWNTPNSPTRIKNQSARAKKKVNYMKSLSQHSRVKEKFINEGKKTIENLNDTSQIFGKLLKLQVQKETRQISNAYKFHKPLLNGSSSESSKKSDEEASEEESESKLTDKSLEDLKISPPATLERRKMRSHSNTSTSLHFVQNMLKKRNSLALNDSNESQKFLHQLYDHHGEKDMKLLVEAELEEKTYPIIASSQDIEANENKVYSHFRGENQPLLKMASDLLDKTIKEISNKKRKNSGIYTPESKLVNRNRIQRIRAQPRY